MPFTLGLTCLVDSRDQTPSTGNVGHTSSHQSSLPAPPFSVSQRAASRHSYCYPEKWGGDKGHSQGTHTCIWLPHRGNLQGTRAWWSHWTLTSLWWRYSLTSTLHMGEQWAWRDEKYLLSRGAGGVGVTWTWYNQHVYFLHVLEYVASIWNPAQEILQEIATLFVQVDVYL